MRKMLNMSPATDTAGRMQLGYSIVDSHAHSGSLATIYVEPVTKLAHDAGIGAGILLGRAVAHEIGHLLLGTSNHAPSGLMRAIWSAETLQRDEAVDWLFAADDAAGLRGSVRLLRREVN